MNSGAAASRLLSRLGSLALACSVFGSCESITEVIAHEGYSATLTGAAVRPDSVVTNGSGTFEATLTSDTTVMTFDLTYEGLSAPATSAHIHGPAVDTVAADVLVDFDALPAGGSGTLLLGTSGSASGSIDLARDVTASVSGDSLRKLLQAGLLYVDVHTATHSGGEIRGQLRR